MVPFLPGVLIPVLRPLLPVPWLPISEPFCLVPIIPPVPVPVSIPVLRFTIVCAPLLLLLLFANPGCGWPLELLSIPHTGLPLEGHLQPGCVFSGLVPVLLPSHLLHVVLVAMTGHTISVQSLPLSVLGILSLVWRLAPVIMLLLPILGPFLATLLGLLMLLLTVGRPPGLAMHVLTVLNALSLKVQGFISRTSNTFSVLMLLIQRLIPGLRQ